MEVKWRESHSVMSNSLWPHGLYSPWNSPGQNTGVGSRSLLQGIFPTQGLNPGLPHCRGILYQLSHQGSPRILEWVAYLFSRASSWTQGSNQGLLHCRQILYQLNYPGSPAEWKRRLNEPGSLRGLPTWTQHVFMSDRPLWPLILCLFGGYLLKKGGGQVKRRMKECVGIHRGHTWSSKVMKLMPNLNPITLGPKCKSYLTLLRVPNHVFWLLGAGGKQAHRAACPFLFQMERSVGASEGMGSRELGSELELAGSHGDGGSRSRGGWRTKRKGRFQSRTNSGSRHGAVWVSYAHVHSFSESLPHAVITESWGELPVICLLYRSMCVLILGSWFTPPPPLDTVSLFSSSVSLFLFCK